MHTPSKEEIKTAREAVGLTQAQAASAAGITLNGWQKAEYGENGMAPGTFWIFTLNTRLTDEEMVNLSNMPDRKFIASLRLLKNSEKLTGLEEIMLNRIEIILKENQKCTHPRK